jgi:hypothetical protein
MQAYGDIRLGCIAPRLVRLGTYLRQLQDWKGSVDVAPRDFALLEEAVSVGRIPIQRGL